MTPLANHPGAWLRADAAAQLDLFELHHGVIDLESAGRTEADQKELIRRWDEGGKYNRPPYLFEPKRPWYESTHVYDGGIAVDTSSIQKMLDHAEPYGFYRRYDWDKPHFEFDPARVKIRPSTPSPLPPLPEGKTMNDIKQIHYKNSSGRIAGRAIIVPGTSYAVPWTESGSTYANALGTEWKTGNSVELTKSLFDAFIAGAARMTPSTLTIQVVDADES